MDLKEYAKLNRHQLPVWKENYKNMFGNRRAVLPKNLNEYVRIEGNKIIFSNTKSKGAFETKIKQALYALIKYSSETP